MMVLMPRSSAAVLKGEVVRVFRPRPVGFGGRRKTDMLEMRDGWCEAQAVRERRTEALRVSEPQKRMFRGSGGGFDGSSFRGLSMISVESIEGSWRLGRSADVEYGRRFAVEGRFWKF